jgi:hypothetical protein
MTDRRDEHPIASTPGLKGADHLEEFITIVSFEGEPEVHVRR